ncbi:MAG TPA: amino acid ABC transporter permease [Candidatus Methylomirabilis sp.]
MTYTFHWEVPLQNLPQFLWGALATLEMSGVACLLGSLVAVGGALARLSKNKYLRRTATAYVEIIRNTPFIVQLFYVYFGLVTVGINLEAFSVAIITLTLNCGAYCTEIIRAGIQSIHKGQREAAFSLGMTEGQSMFLVVLPQAVRRILPPLAGQFITLIKDSSLISVIAVSDLTYVAKNIVTNTFRAFEVWLAIAVFYFVLSFALSWSVRSLEYRLAKSD